MRPPFLWVRYCEEELPLLHFVRELIDDYNWQVSVSADILPRRAQLVYVLRNYGGESLEQFVREMRESLAVQVEGDGGVDTLQAQLDMNAVNSLLDPAPGATSTTWRAAWTRRTRTSATPAARRSSSGMRTSTWTATTWRRSSRPCSCG